MGVIGGAKLFGLINVEEIAGMLIMQHYRTETALPDHIHFVSAASEIFLVYPVLIHDARLVGHDCRTRW
ncbi:hypothetical protein [Polymorphobacter megasporae]|uniref:hypothetical protein n=1 Tax=Glacieibacterium megasporae TaxID=2835787 RepID=UPI001C1E3BA8|nr:hypothetical protein [Polymorphobacter megasporae]UAJ10490.1 hypothetical protein KTC28_01625 [Polymorphobacter megasporae]